MNDFINTVFSGFAMTDGSVISGATPFALCFSLAVCAIVVAGAVVSGLSGLRSLVAGERDLSLDDTAGLSMDWHALSVALDD